ncbi:hypothetical protein SDC9_152766 [bioreactor metagenome]|uniref:DUF5348 domain-containing protein n=1 Tax=bioreactor metagenome TaxID=1076179 RepID=A0A645EU10_9ZZZZ
MKYGKLFYDSELDRVNVSFGNGLYGDGFHCGDTFEIYNPENSQWEWQRLEYSHSDEEWFFVETGSIPAGIEIRIDA